jgi:hypothetical protein
LTSALHFVGSVPLRSAAEVFGTLGRRFGAVLDRIPDGETGERIDWLQFQERVFATNPAFEPIAGEVDWRNANAQRPQTVRFRLRAGVAPDTVRLGPLGYAASALASYAAFRRAQADGAVPRRCRYMVALPSPYNVISWAIDPGSRVAVERLYEAQLLTELDEICAAIPHAALAIQWDCAHDMQAFDGARTPWFEPAREGIIARLARIGDRVPAGVELGYHLCYGSFGGRHFVEPEDAGAMVDLVNGVTAAVRRPIQWVHMPVPVERDDDAYFAPLARLAAGDARIYLGLIHDSDGLAGTRARFATARRHLAHFGIATECGFGRRPASTVPALLDLHSACAALG